MTRWYRKAGAWLPQPATSDPVTAGLLARTDLIYGSEVGAWRTNGGPAISNATAIARITDARIPLIRWAVRDTFVGLTNSSLGQAGVQVRADFDTAINGFINTLGTVPMIKFPPITREALGTPVGPASTTRNVTVTTTNGSTTITAPAGTFRPRDALAFITGAGIPAGARITPYVSSSQVGIALRASSTSSTYTTTTATASGTVTAAVGHDDTTSHQATFSPVYGSDTTLAQNLDTYKAVVAQAGDRVRIYESNNEMEYVGWRFWAAQGAAFSSAGSSGVSTMLGKHFSATMPALKKYARGLGWEIITMGYAGIGGGTGWGDTLAKPNTRTFTEFNTAVHNAFVAAKGDPDYIPDAISVHAYPHSGEFNDGTPTDDVITYWDNWAVAQRSILRSIWGTTIGNQIKLSVSEWNAGFDNSGGAGWAGFTTLGGDDVVYFYDRWLRMLRRNGFWHASCFALSSNGAETYDMVTETGTTRPQYAPFKALSSAKA